MNSIVYVGMDVHKESYTVCCYSFDTDEVMYKQKMAADYKLILKYVEQLRSRFSADTEFICEYEAGLDLCQYFRQKKLKGYAAFFSSSSSFC